jgi:hypothetical protein
MPCRSACGGTSTGAVRCLTSLGASEPFRPLRRKSIAIRRSPLWKGVAFAAGLGLSMLSYPVHAAPADSGDTVQGLYDALLGTMKNGRTLGQSGELARRMGETAANAQPE